MQGAEMDWKLIHHWAEEATLWSQLFINSWAILTGIAIVISKWVKRALSPLDVLILASLSFLLIAWAFGGGLSWWFLVEGLYEPRFGPLPLPIQVVIFGVPTAWMFYYYVHIFRQEIGKRQTTPRNEPCPDP
jgi:hypothetical protein